MNASLIRSAPLSWTASGPQARPAAPSAWAGLPARLQAAWSQAAERRRQRQDEAVLLNLDVRVLRDIGAAPEVQAAAAAQRETLDFVREVTRLGGTGLGAPW